MTTRRVVSRLGTRAIEHLDADPRTLERLFPGKRGRELAAAWEAWRKDWQRCREAADLELQLVSAGATPTAARQVVSYFRG